MKFWDSSALLPLLLAERATVAVRGIARKDGDMAVWWATPVECHSAIARRQREGGFGPAVVHQLNDALSALSAVWSEVQPTGRVRLLAQRLLTVHPLRAADALQLAAALVWAEEAPRGLDFVCLDEQLRIAARTEGFTVLPARLPD